MTFEELYRNYYNKVYYFIYKRINSHEESEDLTGTIFMKCYENFDKYDPAKAKISTWLFVIVKNTLKNYYRDKPKSDYVSSDAEDFPEIPDTGIDDMGKAVWLEQLRETVKEVLAQLPEEKREIIIMRYFRNMSYKQIADATGRSEGSIRVAVSRTQTDLRPLFEAAGVAPEYLST